MCPDEDVQGSQQSQLFTLRRRLAYAEAAKQRAEATLQAVVEGAARTGEVYFQWLVRYLGQTLGVRYAYIAELVGDAQDQMRTLAFWRDGALGDTVTYDLAGSPCETVLRQHARCRECWLYLRLPSDGQPHHTRWLQFQCVWRQRPG